MKIESAKVLVTGAAGGIGSAVARRLAASGASLLLTDMRTEPLERAAADLLRVGANVATVTADLSDDAARAALVAKARDLDINVLINAAGINPFGLLTSQPGAEIGKTMLVNAVAPMLLCRAMIPLLAERERAHIVNVGSTFGSVGFPGFCTYSASKFALRGFSEALRRELADTSVRVHYVAPRATKTALATSRIRAMNEELRVGMDSPETVAAAIERALRHERRETFLGVPERLLATINSILPGLIDRVLRRQLTLIRRYAMPNGDDAPPAQLPIQPNP